MSPHAGKPIGDRLDALGCRALLGENDLISDAVVIMRVIAPNGDTYVKHIWSEGMDWVSRRGLVEVVRDTERVDASRSQ